MDDVHVAMLLTDVEASTGLLVRRGQAGVVALGRVAELVSQAVGEHGGQVSRLQGEGDSAVVLFPSASRAVEAALALNERMAAERWPAGERVRVRSAIHVGDVTGGEEGIFGLEVHRCARLRSLADGGEVFLSEAAARDVGDLSPSRASVADEGMILLRGFAEPERVWRLVHPVLSPRLRPVVGSTSNAAAAMPSWGTSFVGRDAEVESIVARLGAGRVVTLVGPGGVGKTRLASVVASQSRSRVCFVDLTAAAKDGDVHAVAAEALGADRASSPLAGVEAALVAAPALVVVDNCEHVLDAAASLVDHIVTRCRASSVLATSRAPLRVPGEDRVPVAPLPTARGGPATRLFLDRARAVRGDLVTNAAVLEDVDAVTALLDGVPLAIELAAARVTAFTVGEILALLRHDVAGLRDAGRRGTDRHRTLRAAIEWSIRLLADEERTLLCRLAVLPGTFRLATATAVASKDDHEGRELAAAMPSLIEQSLVVAEHGVGPTRYRLLEVIRAVGQEELSVVERAGVLDRLVAHCIAELTPVSAHDLPASGFGTQTSMDSALYSAAIEHTIATKQTDLGLRLVHDLFPAWPDATQRRTIDRWMTELVGQALTPSRIRGMVLRRQAILRVENLGDYEGCTRLFDAAEADAIAIGNRALLGRVRGTRASIDIDHDHFDGVEARLLEALALQEETNDQWLASSLMTLADLYLLHAQFEQANAILDRAAKSDPVWFQRIEIEQMRAWCALDAGNIESAATAAAKSLEMATQAEHADRIADAIELPALVALARGETPVARQLFVQMVALAREHELSQLSDALAGLATVSSLDGDLLLAVACRDELRALPSATRPRHRLARALVDLLDNRDELAAITAAQVRDEAERFGRPYVHLLSLEILAACAAGDDPQRARDLLNAAADERALIGARAWPLDPYRHTALRRLATATMPGAQPPTPS